MKVKVLQSCLTLYTVHGLYSPWNFPGQSTRVATFPFSRGSSQTRDQSQGSFIAGGFLPAEPQGKSKNTGVGSLFLLQGIFPTQELNRGLLHCRQILYQLSYQGSPRILEWVAYPFSRGSSRSKNQTGSPALQADSLPAEFTKKKRLFWHHLKIRSFYRKLHVSGDFLEKSVGR